jgi:hypothetical protein
MLDIILRPGVYLKHDVSETLFCLRLQVELAQMNPIEELVSVSGPDSFNEIGQQFSCSQFTAFRCAIWWISWRVGEYTTLLEPNR